MVNFSKNRLYIAGFLVSVFLFGPSCKRQRQPENVLSRVEMVQALAELYVTEEKVNRLSLRRDSAEKVFELIRPKMFEKIGTSDSVFKQSWEYYLDRPEDLEVIYSALVDTLSLREQKASIKPGQQ